MNFILNFIEFLHFLIMKDKLIEAMQHNSIKLYIPCAKVFPFIENTQRSTRTHCVSVEIGRLHH